MLYDLVILGGGPAGVAAGVYAARKRLKTLQIAGEIGGQSIVSDQIQNWIGIPAISGVDLAKALNNHLKAYAGDSLEIREREFCQSIEKKGAGFVIRTNKGSYDAKTVLITTGAKRRKLTVPGADKFENKGLTYCASCDGPLFADMDVVVIGGGNAGFETAAQLLAYCKSVTLLHRREQFKADEITVSKILENPKMKAVGNAEITEISGDKFITSISYKDSKNEQIYKLEVQGVFAEIGSIPATEFAKEIAQIDEFGRIITNPKNNTTSTEGIWAAGDCTNGLYHQNNIAMGDAVRALEDIYLWLQTK